MTPLAALSLLFAGEAPSSPYVPAQVAQLTVRERIIVRVPTGVSTTRVTWKDSKGPRCTSMDMIAGAVVAARDSVDLVLRTGERMRAQFRSSCPALDFYSGFYVLPTADRRICADRDSIHARSGGECEIERFRRLKPVTIRTGASATVGTIVTTRPLSR